jgi:hypothetical protein
VTYIKQTWTDLPSASTPITAARLGYIEDGVEAAHNLTMPMTIALSDETTALTAGNAKVTWRAPFAMNILAIRASLTVASTSGIPWFNVKKNGTSIMDGNYITIDANEKTSVTAATQANVTNGTIADDDELTFDIITAGTGAKGAKITLYYKRS